MSETTPIHFAKLFGEVFRRAKWKVGDEIPKTSMRCQRVSARHLGRGEFHVTAKFVDVCDGEMRTHDDEDVVSVADPIAA